MHTFRVWAPDAGRVDLELTVPTPDAGEDPQVRTAPMQRDPAPGLGHAGWWQLEVAEAGPGSDYAFSLDGGPGRPDPRSAEQPRGVDGPSRVVDARSFAWTDGDWAGRDARGGVVYELHVGTFTPEGTFAAAAAHLDHLVDLGVDVVELLPVVAFPGRWGWGYDGVDLFAVHEPYGGPQGLAAFVDAAHGRGLAVCLDVVYNHLGPAGNYLGEFGPYFTTKHDTPWGAAVNLDDTGSGEVRRFILDAATRWLRDFHVDALRLDAVHALVDDSAEHLLTELSREVSALSAEVGRPLTLIAESDLNDAAMVTPPGEPTGSGLAARGMGAQWADDVHHALHATLTGERQGYYVDFGGLDVLAKVLREVFLHDGRYSPFREREWGAPVDAARYGGHRFIAYTTTHDQTGNRATGDRLSAQLDDGQLAVAAALVLTSPFTPMVFMGEEWGARTPWQFFTDHTDPELGRAVSEGRAQEFAGHGWDADEIPDPQDPGTRDASVLDWDEAEGARGARLLDWHRQLIALRRAEEDLRDDHLPDVGVEVGGDEASGWVVVQRGALRIAVNLADAPQEVPLAGLPEAAEVVLAWEPGATELTAGDAGGAVRLPAHAAAVVRLH